MRLEELFLNLLNMSITAGYVVIAVFILRLLLKKAPRWISCALWALVGLRLILPFSFESVMSLIPSSDTVTPDILYSAEPAISGGVPAVNSVISPETLSPAVSAGASPAQTVISVAAFVWLAGVLAMVLYSAVTYIRLRRKVDSAVLFRDNIYESDSISSPFVLGIVRPRIYLPFTVAKGDRDYVVSHELTHIRRKDHWIKPFGFLLLTVYWFNPLMWAAYILLCRDIEVACDETVIKDIDGPEKKAYSLALLNCAVKRRNIAMCPLAFGEVGIKERVKNVLSYKKPAFWIIIVAVAACIVAAVCLLSNPKENNETATENSYAEQLFQYRTAYVGDNSAVSNIVGLLDFPSDTAYDHIELQTDSEPYGISVYFNVIPEGKANYDLSEPENIGVFRKNACVMFSLIENIDTVSFLLDSGSENPVNLKFNREWAYAITGADLWEESGSAEDLESLITLISERVGTADASAGESVPTGTFKPAGMVYLGPWYNVTPDYFLEQNKDKNIEIESGMFRDDAVEYDAQFALLDIGDTISVLDGNGDDPIAIAVSGYGNRAGWRVLAADGSDTGYRIFRMDSEIWIGHWGWYGSNNDAWWCEYIFKVETEENGVGVSAAYKAASVEGTGPFVGYEKNADDDTFAVYTEKGGSYIMSLPWSLLDDFPGSDQMRTSWEHGWMDIDIYCGTMDGFTWAVAGTGPHLGTGDANVCTSADGGETWWVGDKKAMYPGTLTGAGFASPDVGFMSYRYYSDQGPEIARTLDGGSTWERMTVDIPDYLTDYCFTPLSPTFTGDSGAYPIELYKNAYFVGIAYLITEDGGTTWQWQGKISNAES